MLKKIFYTFLFIMLMLAAKAQNYDAGFLGGLGGCQVDGDGYGGYKKFGFYAGGFVNLTFKDIHNMQMEMCFSEKGSKKNPNYIKNDLEAYKLKLHYVDLALVYTNWFFGKIGLEGGLMGSYNINGREWINSWEQAPLPPMRKLTASFVLGAKYNIAEQLMVTIRFNYSCITLRTRPTAGNSHRFFQNGQFSNNFFIGLQYTI